MKKLLSTIILLGLLLSGCEKKANNNDKNEPIADTEEIMTKKLRHVVLFKFKESSSKVEIKALETAFAELPKKIKEIKDFEWGINNSPEGLDKGFTHCFLVTFDSEEDRSIYLPHPDHKAFVDLLGTHVDDVLVLDYWIK
ncbi:Dabb family protein [Winogradskyella sp. PE311]|uniref:Dabb family protein n=1 Tax=Winogradskyella sp. PE311 TaxID=3366943 RepID=UPI0039808157